MANLVSLYQSFYIGLKLTYVSAYINIWNATYSLDSIFIGIIYVLQTFSEHLSFYISKFCPIYKFCLIYYYATHTEYIKMYYYS